MRAVCPQSPRNIHSLVICTCIVLNLFKCPCNYYHRYFCFSTCTVNSCHQRKAWKCPSGCWTHSNDNQHSFVYHPKYGFKFLNTKYNSQMSSSAGCVRLRVQVRENATALHIGVWIRLLVIRTAMKVM